MEGSHPLPALKGAMKPKQKPYREMTTAELRQATKEFEREELGLPGKPLTATDRKFLAQARRRGQGTKIIEITLDPPLRRQLDAAAKRLRISRSKLVARCLRKGLRLAG
jgi:hypothetical protein